MLNCAFLKMHLQLRLYTSPCQTVPFGAYFHLDTYRAALINIHVKHLHPDQLRPLVYISEKFHS